MKPTNTEEMPTSAFAALDNGAFHAGTLTRGPWHPDHQHAGPPIALVCRAIEQAAAAHGLTHVARLTANLLRPVPLGEVWVECAIDYLGRNSGHFSAKLMAAGKEVARFTALVQRKVDLQMPAELSAHPLPAGLKPPDDCAACVFPFAGRAVGYADLVETRLVEGRMFDGPCVIWFRMQHPLLQGETPSGYQRVLVAADSGNGISAVLDINAYSYVNSDLTVNLLRQPQGEWICLQARSYIGTGGGGLAESALYDELGFIGRATQSLAVARRSSGGDVTLRTNS